MTWFETKRGSDLLSLEHKILDQLFDHLFGYNIVQIGNHRSLIENSRFKNKYTRKQIQFDAEQLPFESDAIDCFVLPHQNTEDERMLSEVYRSLMPHGHAIFINFNPWSLIGLRTFFSMSSEEPWNHNLESFTSFQNKLLKQDFEIVNGKFFGYHPRFKSASNKSRWDKIGDRWFPLFANIYLIVVRKKIFTMTPIKPSWNGKIQRNQVKVKETYEL